MSDDILKLQSLRRRYRDLPYTPLRSAVNLEYVTLADQLGLPHERVSGRYDLAWAYAMGDDPVKALPVCAEFFALWEEYPDAVPGRIEGPSAAMIANYVAASLPQVPLEQCRELLEQFRRQTLKFGVGERLWQMHACSFCLMTGDMAGAEEHFALFQAMPRDDLSDCAACEASNAAELLLKMGRREEAMSLIQPVLDRKLTCEQQPWDILAILIHDALDREDTAAARGFARRMFLHRIQRPGDLPCAGALMRLQAVDTGLWSNPGQLAKCLIWSMGLWDQNLLFHFYLGADAYCRYLGQRQNGIRLSLPSHFPLYQEEGIYSCQTLAGWFYDQAADIAGRFDRRNGTDAYMRRLLRAGAGNMR